MGKLLVTGASGQLGRRVVELLRANGAQVVAASRTPDKLSEGVEHRRIDFDDAASMERAFAGVERVLIISTDALDGTTRRRDQQVAAVEAAKRAGVKHIVYTSMPSPGPESLVPIAFDHRETEQAVVKSGLEYTLLRNNLYTDLFAPGWAHAVSSGVLRAAVGQGAIGYVTREDCAHAAAAALRSTHVGSRTLNVSGKPITYTELAQALADVTKRPVRYEAITVPQRIDGLKQAGLPEPVAAVMAAFDAAGAAGQLDTKSDVESLTGRAPQSVRSYLEANRGQLGV